MKNKMGDDSTTWTAFVFTFLLVLALQGGGCFTGHWVSTDRCGDVGLFSDCCLEHCNASSLSYEGARYLSVPSSGMQVFSFVVFLGACIFMCCVLIRDDDDDDDDSFNACCCCLCCCFILYPVAGITSVVGCSYVTQSDLPDDSSLGYSFYLSLFAGIYVILQVVALCCGLCCNKKSRNPPPRPATVATTSASRQIDPIQSNWSVDVAEHEEVHESGGMMFVRRLKITRVTAYFR